MPRTVPRNASVSPKLEIGKGWQFFLFVQYLKLNIASSFNILTIPNSLCRYSFDKKMCIIMYTIMYYMRFANHSFSLLLSLPSSTKLSLEF